MVVVGIEKPKSSQKMAVIEAQMLTKTYFQYIKKVDGLTDLILEITKAVAQIPYK